MFDVDSYIAAEKDKKRVSGSKKNRIIELDLADSHGCLAIIKLYNSNLIISFIKEKITENAQKYFRFVLDEYLKISRIDTRFLSFSTKVIFIFREFFEPITWFYKPNESFPEPKKLLYNKNRTESELYKEKTVGKILFERLAKSYPTYQSFSNEYKIPVDNIKNMLRKSIFVYNGKKEIRYNTFVTKSVINKLKEEIHPDYWFMFPEELPKEDPAYNIVFGDINGK